MQKDLLDNPEDWRSKPKNSYVLTWWSNGLLVGISMLILNLLRLEGFLSIQAFLDEDFLFVILGFGVYTAAAFWLSKNLDKTTVDPIPWKYALAGAGAGILGSSILFFLKYLSPLFGFLSFPPFELTLLLLILGGYMGLICSASLSFRGVVRNRIIWLAFTVLWIVLVLLFLGSPNSL